MKENFSELSSTILDKLEKIFKDNIIKGRWKRGEKINLLELQEEYKVSRTPIRDALNRLKNNKIIIVIPRVGYYVRDFNLKEINDIFELRKILEINALKISIEKIDKNKLDKLLQKIILLKTNLSITDKKFKADWLFGENLHTLIIDNCENKLLKKAYYDIYDYVEMLWNFSFPFKQDLIGDHINIIKSIHNKNCIKSTKLLEKHINKVKNIIINNS